MIFAILRIIGEIRFGKWKVDKEIIGTCKGDKENGECFSDGRKWNARFCGI